MSKDVPLVPDDDSKPYGAQIVDLGEVRIQWGRTPPRHTKCAHRSLTYSRDERRVWCNDCERTIDSFDAFMTVTNHFEKMESAARHKLFKAEEASRATIIRRAAKEIDRTWGAKMAPCCPHCRSGLLPEDFTERGVSAVSAEILRAKRVRDAKGPA